MLIPHFFRFCLPRIETKNKIICIDAPKYAFTHRNLPESEKYIWIIQNVHEKSWFFYISITRQWSLVQPDTQLSPPLWRQSSFSSAASHQCLWDIAAAWLAVIFFSRHNRFAETHIHLQLSYHITDRLLAAGNDTKYNAKKILRTSKFWRESNKTLKLYVIRTSVDITNISQIQWWFSMKRKKNKQMHWGTFSKSSKSRDSFSLIKLRMDAISCLKTSRLRMALIWCGFQKKRNHLNYM